MAWVISFLGNGRFQESFFNVLRGENLIETFKSIVI